MDNMGLHFSNLTKNSRLGMYIPVPVCLLTTPLSSTTLLIYGSLLNRAMLSQKNDWSDESGEIFVCFSIKEIAAYVGRGISTVKAALKELEGVGLIRRKRMDLYTTRIYVKVPGNCLMSRKTGSAKSENNPGRVEKSGLQTAGKPTTNNNTDIRNTTTEMYAFDEGESL